MNLSSVSNPYLSDSAGVQMLGTSGKLCVFQGPIYRIWCSISPIRVTVWTTWDPPWYTSTLHPPVLINSSIFIIFILTISGVSLQKYDPLLLPSFPHIYFCGNTPEFRTEIFNCEQGACRLICVPDFSLTKSFVLVDFSNLECFEVQLWFIYEKIYQQQDFLFFFPAKLITPVLSIDSFI